VVIFHKVVLLGVVQRSTLTTKLRLKAKLQSDSPSGLGLTEILLARHITRAYSGKPDSTNIQLSCDVELCK